MQKFIEEKKTYTEREMEELRDKVNNSGSHVYLKNKIHMKPITFQLYD